MQTPIAGTVGVDGDDPHHNDGDEVGYRRDEADLKVAQHVDRRSPDAIYVSAKAPVQLVRKVVNPVRLGVTHIFPLNYSKNSAGEMQGIRPW